MSRRHTVRVISLSSARSANFDQLESDRLDLGEGGTVYIRQVYAKIGVHLRTEAVGAPEPDGPPAPS